MRVHREYAVYCIIIYEAQSVKPRNPSRIRLLPGQVPCKCTIVRLRQYAPQRRINIELAHIDSTTDPPALRIPDRFKLRAPCKSTP